MKTPTFMERLGEIRWQMACGGLSYDEAKEKAQPIIDEMNEVSARIAREYGKKPGKFTFSKLMR